MSSCWDLNIDESQRVDLFNKNVLEKPSFFIKLKRSRGSLCLPPPTVELPYLQVSESPLGVSDGQRNQGKGCFSLSFSLNDLFMQSPDLPRLYL